MSYLVTAVCIPGLIPPLHCSASTVILFCYCRVVKQTKNFSSKCSDWQSRTVAFQRPTTKLSLFPFLRSLEEETRVGQRERRRHKQRHRETDRVRLIKVNREKENQPLATLWCGNVFTLWLQSVFIWCCILRQTQ